VCDQFGLAFREACPVDVGVTGDADFATEAAAAQASGLGRRTAGSSEIDNDDDDRHWGDGRAHVLGDGRPEGHADRHGQSIAGVDLRVRDRAAAPSRTCSPRRRRDSASVHSAGNRHVHDLIDPRDLLVGTLASTLSDVPDNDGDTARRRP
jgi:hypothetical protein